MESRWAALPARLPRGETGLCAAAGRRSPVSFAEVAVSFTEEEWALLDPDQRKLFWNVMAENFETVASLRDYISQKDLQAPERATLPVLGIQGGSRTLWDVQNHRVSLLSSFPRMESGFGFGTSAGKPARVGRVMMQPPPKVSGVRGVSWREREILDLLDIWGDARIQEALRSSHRNIGIFEKIAAEMAARGHRRSAEECRTKTKTMRMEYRKVLAHNNQTGSAPATCPFFEELNKICGSGSASVPQRLVRSIQYRPPTPPVPPEPQQRNPQPQAEVFLPPPPDFQPAPGSEDMFSHLWHTVDVEQIRESEPGDAGALAEAGGEEDSDAACIENFPEMERASISSQATAASPEAVPVGAAAGGGATADDDPGEGTSAGQLPSSPSSGLPRSRVRRRRVPGLASISERMMEQSRILFERESEERREELTQSRQQWGQSCQQWEQSSQQRAREFELTRQDRLMIHDTMQRGVVAMEGACQALQNLVAMHAMQTQASVPSGQGTSVGEGERPATSAAGLGVAARTPLAVVPYVPPRADPPEPQGSSAPQTTPKRLRFKKKIFSP